MMKSLSNILPKPKINPASSLGMVLIVATLFLLTSCGTMKHETRKRMADIIAHDNGFEPRIVKAGQFWLQTYQKITNPNLPYVFYIEGDGFAFVNKYTISEDPTPRNPMVLRLAVKDFRSNIVYIAKPCQYTPPGMDIHCNNSYWTNKRMAPEVVYSISEAIKNISHNQPIDLIGYSGGGGIAVLVAERNPKKVRTILTFAANLDHKFFNQYHNVRPMIGSLNPIDVAQKIRNIPQLHLSGGRDDIVNAAIADRFIQASNSPCVRQEILPKITHNSGWEEVWKSLISIPITCSQI